MNSINGPASSVLVFIAQLVEQQVMLSFVADSGKKETKLPFSFRLYMVIYTWTNLFYITN